MIYHGTKNAKDFNIHSQYVSSEKRGRMEGGSGLYTIDSYYAASRFGKVFGLVSELKESEDAKHVLIDQNKVLDLVSCFPTRM